MGAPTTDEMKEKFLRSIPDRGISNPRLRDELKWTEEKYERIRDLLADEGKIERGRGPGGTVYRVDARVLGGILASKQRTFVNHLRKLQDERQGRVAHGRLREVLGWTELEYREIFERLVERGRVGKGGGPGGTVYILETIEDEEFVAEDSARAASPRSIDAPANDDNALLRLLANHADGCSRSSLQESLGWDDDQYADARTRLLNRGLVRHRMGRGGGLALAAPAAAPPVSAPVHAATPAAATPVPAPVHAATPAAAPPVSAPVHAATPAAAPPVSAPVHAAPPAAAPTTPILTAAVWVPPSPPRATPEPPPVRERTLPPPATPSGVEAPTFAVTSGASRADAHAYRELRDAYAEGNVVAFVGAGASLPSGLPSWRVLLDRLLEHARVEELITPAADAEIVDYVRHGSYIDAMSALRYPLGTVEFSSFIRRELNDRDLEPSPLAHALAQLNNRLRAVLTTNIDRLLERAFPQSWTTLVRPTGDLAQQRNVIVKLHGTLENPNGWIFTREQYEDAYYNHPVYRSYFSTMLHAYHMMFVGYGLDDGDFNQLLASIRATSRNQPPRHFAFIDASSIRPDRRRKLQDAGIRIISYRVQDHDHGEMLQLVRGLGEPSR